MLCVYYFNIFISIIIILYGLLFMYYLFIILIIYLCVLCCVVRVRSGVFFGKHKKTDRGFGCVVNVITKKYDDMWCGFRVFRVVCSNFRFPILTSYSILSRKMVSATGILNLSFIVSILLFLW